MAATEARSLFGTNAIVSTIHALAYYYVVKPYHLNPDITPFISWRDIPKSIRIPFGKTDEVTELISLFCDSVYTDFSAFLANEYPDTPMSIELPAKQILDLMASGKMRCTHAFYLKLFHILVVSNTLQLEPIDTLIVDEVQDLTPITRDIVINYPASQKILIGDSAQSIFQWMGCVNIFHHYKSQGKTLHLSRSFRVDSKFAPAIQKFLQLHHDPEAQFIGQPYESSPIRTKAYITLTNNAIIQKMAECSDNNIPYKLAHSAKVSQMFKLPVFLICCKPGEVQRDHELKHLQQDVDDWATLPEATRPSKMTYLAKANLDNPAIQSALKLIVAHSTEKIMRLYKEAESHKKGTADLTLLTSFASKGSTFDEVTLDNELDLSIKDFLDKPLNLLDAEEQEAFYVYFVAITRHRYKINNASYLKELMEATNAKQ